MLLRCCCVAAASRSLVLGLCICRVCCVFPSPLYTPVLWGCTNHVVEHNVYVQVMRRRRNECFILRLHEDVENYTHERKGKEKKRKKKKRKRRKKKRREEKRKKEEKQQWKKKKMPLSRKWREISCYFCAGNFPALSPPPPPSPHWPSQRLAPLAPLAPLRK